MNSSVKKKKKDNLVDFGASFTGSKTKSEATHILENKIISSHYSYMHKTIPNLLDDSQPQDEAFSLPFSNSRVIVNTHSGVTLLGAAFRMSSASCCSVLYGLGLYLNLNGLIG